MSIVFKQVARGETYDRWVSECGLYILARYMFRSVNYPPYHEEHRHYDAYYLNDSFPGSSDLKTYEEAEAACLAHQEQRNQSIIGE